MIWLQTLCLCSYFQEDKPSTATPYFVYIKLRRKVVRKKKTKEVIFENGNKFFILNANLITEDP